MTKMLLEPSQTYKTASKEMKEKRQIKENKYRLKCISKLCEDAIKLLFKND